MAIIGFDRVDFLEAAKTETFTIKEIEQRFNVTGNTARNWTSKLPQIIKIEGSYPYAFTHKDNAHPFAKPREMVDLTGYVKLFDISLEAMDHTIEENLLPEQGSISKINVRDFILSIDSEARAKSVESQLIGFIQIARRYYETQIKE